MKQQLVYMILALALLAACEKPGEAGGGELPTAALELRVNAGDFTTNGTPATRAADNGNVTVFVENDRVGVIVVGHDGTLLHDNVPYKYNHGQWAFDSDNDEGKAACYYSPGVTYIVYYPYDKAADGVTDLSALERRFPPRIDQREEEDYRASDLMACSTTNDASGGTLTVTLQHVYTSVSVSPEITKCVLDDGKQTPYPNIQSRFGTFEVNLSIDDKVYRAFPAADGSYRCIFPGESSAGITCFYTLSDGNIYSNTITTSPAWKAGIRYVSTPQFTITYTLNLVTSGDFCCKSTEGKIYFIPAEATLDKTQKETCQGIVFYRRESDSPGDKGEYDEFSGLPVGYIIGLEENTGQWATYDINDDDTYPKDVIDGYFQTYKVERNTRDDCVAMTWCRNKVTITDNNSGSAVFSKWYMMSYQELYLLTRQLEVIQASLAVVGGQVLQNSPYFTAARMGMWANYNHILNPITMSEEGKNHIAKNNYPYRRACAFAVKD